MTIRYVTQKYASDCGIACLAMVTGKEYEDVFAELGFDLEDDEFYTRHSELASVLTGFGWVVKWKKFKDWAAIHETAIVAVNHRNGRQYFHWVVFDGKQIFDPQPSPSSEYRASGWYLLVSKVR